MFTPVLDNKKKKKKKHLACLIVFWCCAFRYAFVSNISILLWQVYTVKYKIQSGNKWLRLCCFFLVILHFLKREFKTWRFLWTVFFSFLFFYNIWRNLETVGICLFTRASAVMFHSFTNIVSATMLNLGTHTHLTFDPVGTDCPDQIFVAIDRVNISSNSHHKS